MTDRLILIACALGVASLTAQAPATKSPESVDARAARIHKQAIVVDTHIDTTQLLVREGWDFMVQHEVRREGVRDETASHVDYPRLREGGLDAAFFSIYMPGTVTGPEAVKRSLVLIDAVRRLAEQHPNEITLATSAADVRAAHRAGKFAALMGMEGGHMIDDNLSVLRDYQRLGVRYLTLTHSVNTNWADSSGDKPVHDGLTDFGKDVVRELNRLGVMVDISHVADKTFWDALEVSKAPLVASHSSARALSGHPRNMTDDMIKALGAKGGVIMINYSTTFLDNDLYEATRNNVPAAERPKVSWERIVEHIDHCVKLAGATHVGLGSDFDGTTVPIGMDDVSKLPKITAALLQKGYSEQDVKNILGENILRLMEKVEQVGREIRAGEAGAQLRQPPAGHRPDHMEHRFDDPERYAKEFDDPARDTWQMPARVIDTLGFHAGQSVADIGAGTGYFSMRLAKVPAAPTVYAVDIEPSMVQYLKARTARDGLNNVIAVQASADSPNLPAPVDTVLIVDTYHHIADRVEYFRRLRAWLKPSGRLVIIDFRKDAPTGPPPEFRFTEAQISSELMQAGYQLSERHTFLPRQLFLEYHLR